MIQKVLLFFGAYHFNLATPFDDIRLGSFLDEEVNYLLNEAHFVLNEIGTILIPPEV